MTKEKTPCEKLDYKVGDKFEVMESSNGFKKGHIIELFGDDGSEVPLFKGDNNRHICCNGKQGAYLHLSRVRKLTVTDENKNAQLKQLIEKRNEKSAKVQKLHLEIDSLNAQIEQLSSEIEQDVSESTGMDCKLTDKEQDSSIPAGVDVYDPVTWKKGDIIECVDGSRSSCATTGKEYVFNTFNGSAVQVLEDDDGDKFTPDATFKFLRRPK